jgi:hypothetical protein
MVSVNMPQFATTSFKFSVKPHSNQPPQATTTAKVHEFHAKHRYFRNTIVTLLSKE